MSKISGQFQDSCEISGISGQLGALSLQRMSEASSVVASVAQQPRQKVPQSRTEYRKRPKAT